MPARVPPEAVARIQQLAKEGKSSRTIALETGIGKSSVARYMSLGPSISLVAVHADTIPAPTVDMLNDNSARSFLNEIGISAPAAALRNDIVPASSPLKNNPKALLIAQKLMGTHNPVTAAHNPVTAAHNPVTAAHNPVTAAQNPVTAAHNPVTAAQKQDPMGTQQDPVPMDSAQLITRIQMNVENFAPLLKHIVKPDTDTFLQELFYKEEAELKLLLRVIERARMTGNMANQFKHVFWMTTGALEAGAPFIGIKAQGLSQALRQQDEEIGLILKEMALERADSFQQAQRPEVRLAFLVSTTLLSVDSMNRIRSGRLRQAPKEQPASPKPASDAEETRKVKYEDL